jgi:hypothetical protein
MFFRRRPFFYRRRPWLRRRYYRRWGCFPGCFTLVLFGLVLAAAAVILL